MHTLMCVEILPNTTCIGTDEYNSLSFAPEFKFIIGDKQNLIRPSGFNLMKLTKVFCEKYKEDADRSCGNGLALSLKIITLHIATTKT